MASPTVPHLQLNVPKKRPAGSQSPQSSKRRKPSSAGPSHLRQTSFPPEPTSAHTPSFRSPSVESSIIARGRTTTPSIISARGGGKPKKRKNARGSTIDDAGSSVVAKGSANGQAGSMVAGEGGEEEDGDEDDLDEARNQATLEGGKMSEAAQKQEREHLAMLLEAFTPEQADRYDLWRRVKLRKDSVRRVCISRADLRTIQLTIDL
jgi:transcription initiation factor TFIID subunit 11